MNALAYLTVRVLHVLGAGLWIGSTVFISLVLTPAVDEAGPAGGQVMTRLSRRGINAYMALLGATTVATGAYLLWRFTGGFSVSPLESHGGLAFCVGGASGVLAALIGGGVVGRTGTKVAATMGQIAAATDASAKQALLDRAAALRGRMKTATRAVIALQALALVLMSIGHYI